MKTVDDAIKYAIDKLPPNVTLNITIASIGYEVEYEVHHSNGVTSDVMGVGDGFSLIDDIVLSVDESQNE